MRFPLTVTRQIHALWESPMLRTATAVFALFTLLCPALADVQIVITTQDNTSVSGTATLGTLEVKTDFGKVQIDEDHLGSIDFDTTDTVMTSSGFQVKGHAAIDSLTLAIGPDKRTLARADLKSLA